MPVYEYRCEACEERCERLLPMRRSDDPGACPACGADALDRRFSRVAVRYASWGFQSTDRLVADRPGRGDYREVAERAERISEGE